MTDETFNRDAWERRWQQALREHPDKVASRPPNDHLVAETRGLPPGRALDAGCGHGAEALWLAASGWKVTAVDFSTTACLYVHVAGSVGDMVTRLGSGVAPAGPCSWSATVPLTPRQVGRPLPRVRCRYRWMRQPRRWMGASGRSSSRRNGPGRRPAQVSTP